MKVRYILVAILKRLLKLREHIYASITVVISHNAILEVKLR